MKEYFGLMGAMITAAASIIYIYDIFKNGAKPNRVSFLIWGIAPVIAALAAFAQGDTWGVAPVLVSGLGPLCVFAASLLIKGAKWETTIFDYACGVFSGLALVLWQITREPNIAIVFSMIADAAAAVPTLRKARTHPETESIGAYLTVIIGQAMAFPATETDRFSAYAFPIYLFACCTTILVVILYGKHRHRVA